MEFIKELLPTPFTAIQDREMSRTRGPMDVTKILLRLMDWLKIPTWRIRTDNFHFLYPFDLI